MDTAVPCIYWCNLLRNQIKALWDEYLSLRENLIFESAIKAYDSAHRNTHHFAIVLEEQLIPSLETWIIQLFQESLGSKITGFNPKTVVTTSEAIPEGFEAIRFNIPSSHIIVKMMIQMHLLQIYVALFAHYRGINFVTQPEVETYKRKMKEVSSQKIPKAEIVTTSKLIERIRETIKGRPQIRFLETVCYWHLNDEQRESIKNDLISMFPEKEIFVFAGSDWNHHSYQAASWNEDTLFIILIKQKYEQKIEGISPHTLNENLNMLKMIAYATYETLRTKAVFLIWSEKCSTN